MLSRLQRRSNVGPAWIVVIAQWTTLSLSTASRLSRRLRLLYCPGVVRASFRQGRVRQLLTTPTVEICIQQLLGSVKETSHSLAPLNCGALSRAPT